jgi:hypothetical protein
MKMNGQLINVVISEIIQFECFYRHSKAEKIIINIFYFRDFYFDN